MQLASLYYGDWATVGLTYFKGYSPFTANFSRASFLSGVSLKETQGSCYRRGDSCVNFSAGDTVDVLNVSEENRFDEVEGIGFEFVKTVGDWSWKIRYHELRRIRFTAREHVFL